MHKPTRCHMQWPNHVKPPDCERPYNWYSSQFFRWNMWFPCIILTPNARLYHVFSVRFGGLLVESLPEGFGDQRSRNGVMPTISEMDLTKDFNTLLLGNTP